MTQMRAAAVALVLVVFCVGCTGEAIDSETGRETVSAPPSDKEVRRLLDTVGLSVYRTIELPGSDSHALVVGVHGDSAFAAWNSARELVPRTGRYPLFVGSDRVMALGDPPSTLDTILEDAARAATAGLRVSDELTAALDIDARTWFDDRVVDLGLSPDGLRASLPLPEDLRANRSFTFAHDIVTREPRESVDLVFLPTAYSWEAAGYFLWGGRTNISSPREHVALHRHWFEEYGAELLWLDSRSMQLRAGSLPPDEPAAVELGREHFLYSPNLYYQGPANYDLLSARVLHDPLWLFSWS